MLSVNSWVEHARCDAVRHWGPPKLSPAQQLLTQWYNNQGHR